MLEVGGEDPSNRLSRQYLEMGAMGTQFKATKLGETQQQASKQARDEVTMDMPWKTTRESVIKL